MGSDASYDQERSHGRNHRDYEPEDASDPGRMSKRRSHRDDKGLESYTTRDRSRSRDRDRDRARHRHRPRRSRSPEPSRRHRSRERQRDERKRRDSSDDSPVRKDRDQRRDDSGDGSRAYGTKRKRRRSPEDAKDDDQDWRQRRKQDKVAADDDPANKGSKQAAIRRATGPLPSQADQFAVAAGEAPEKPKEKPNFGVSGHLAAASNSIEAADGTKITLKYHEPPEARKPAPRDAWKLFVFKGADIVDTIELSHRSCWLVGREVAVVDLPAEHPSVSKQHAVVQFRYVERRNEFGDKMGRVKPYLIDLESANGTRLNGQRVADSRYLELRDKDVVQFGLSTREYVLMLAPRE